MEKRILQKTNVDNENKNRWGGDIEYLLEELKTALKCDYISDLRFLYNDTAKKYLTVLDLKKYSLDQLNVAVTYVFGLDKPFQNKKQLSNFIKSVKDI